MKKFLKALQTIEIVACVLAFSTMIFACALQVFNRNITQLAIKWTEELARYSMVWMAMLGSSIGLRFGKQMSVEFFYTKFPRGVQRVFRVLGDLICGVFCGIVGYYAILTVQQQFINKQLSTALVLPMGAVYLIIPISMFVMMVYEFWALYRDIAGKNEPPKDAGEVQI